MARKLPPLNALRVFEVASRSENFTHAAKILNVSQGAVSRHTAQLEAFLGLRLFVRNQRDVKLTTQGEQYAQAIAEAFDRIELATQLSRRDKQNRVVRIRLFPTVAMKWLVKRLARFHTLYPSINVQVTIANDLVDVSAGEVDFTIRTPAIPKPGVRYDTLFPIELLPVCSPAEFNKHPPVHDSRELLDRTLRHSMKRPHDWRIWFEAADVTPGSFREGLSFGNSSLAYQAAIDGLGIAVAHLELVQDDLKAGRLLAIHPLVVRTADSYHLVGRENRRWQAGDCCIPRLAAVRNQDTELTFLDRQDLALLLSNQHRCELADGAWIAICLGDALQVSRCSRWCGL
ncbi:LysR family glycine cleavage system transcriptional activator [Bradyrhizobium sp. USDA 4532]|uniref:LysR substrate-binding domain-containing protein n=1 Tax=unclassified Bradyrhizobium TaxID=2631580 RepID=UPI0020A12D0F|nr:MULTISPECIES: LysR substrate-binding domain-containing protein [unclassified Bradyrhizobium]MCP1831386.1 LysR family glycine cleavage system transcriptional activator [Bradyrhizobium sp. USDA 4545]MCP1924497.1 LysR family glycine cleavage system transcriptional activator [Bradyrhizobium sp. USDA 4532]